MDRTVFVIGAGASFDFGLPTGEQLIGDISSLFSRFTKHWEHRKTDRGRSLTSTGRAIDYDIAELSDVLTKVSFDPNFSQFNNNDFSLIPSLASGVWLAKSIDNYINEQKEPAISFLGKVAIVSSILKAEGGIDTRARAKTTPTQISLMPKDEAPNNSELNFQDLRRTWLVPFFRELTTGLTVQQLDDRFSSISLIIFNYDRCVEHFLYNALISYYRVTPEVAADLVSKIEIIHAYGQLGALAWQNSSELDRVIEFGDFKDVEKIPLAANRIRTFEESKSEEIMSKAQAAVRESSNLVFLGFGFHKQNMEFLGYGQPIFEGSMTHRRIFATGYKLSKYQQEKVMKTLTYFAAPKNVRRREELIHLDDANCSDLISEYGEEFF